MIGVLMVGALGDFQVRLGRSARYGKLLMKREYMPVGRGFGDIGEKAKVAVHQGVVASTVANSPEACVLMIDYESMFLPR